MRGLRPIIRATQQKAAVSSRRAFSVSQRRAGGDAHGPQYDPPAGWLFGVKPGEKAKEEGWENLMFYGFGGSLIIFAVAYAFKPDTS